ncbi:ferric siderophore transporter TonB, partial [Stenotrophomonas maltophilia]|nr:ferric siderophore transporter TonB [Stenotrophomonas maltophilia]
MRGRQLLVTVALVLAALLVLGIAVWWMLFRDTASTRRPVVQPPMLALPPP